MKLLIDMNLSPRWTEVLRGERTSEAGALLTIDPARLRVTLLPLRR